MVLELNRLYTIEHECIVKSNIIEQTSEKRNTLRKNSRSIVESGMDNATKYGFIKRI